jgi:hypothetical protein
MKKKDVSYIFVQIELIFKIDKTKSYT